MGSNHARQEANRLKRELVGWGAVQDIIQCSDRTLFCSSSASDRIVVEPHPNEDDAGDRYQKMLYALLRNVDMPDGDIVETGMRWGMSTVYILAAIWHQPDRKLHTFECGWDHYTAAEQLDKWKTSVELPTNRWYLYETPSQVGLPELAARETKIAWFHHDSDHSYECQSFEYDWAWRNVVSGGFISSDDYVWDKGRAWNEFVARVQQPWWKVGHMAVMRKP